MASTLLGTSLGAGFPPLAAGLARNYIQIDSASVETDSRLASVVEYGMGTKGSRQLQVHEVVNTPPGQTGRPFFNSKTTPFPNVSPF